MNIVHVITDLNMGGAEMMLFKLLSTVLDGTDRHSVVTLVPGGPMYDAYIRMGVPVYTPRMAQGRPSLPALYRLRRIVSRLRPDVLQGWMYHGNIAAMLARPSRQKTPVIWNVRHALSEFDAYSRMTSAVIRLGSRWSSRTAAIAYNSHRAAERHEAIGYAADRTLIIPNGFDCTKMRPDPCAYLDVRRELELGPSTLIIGLVGRYHIHKDQPNFLRAAARLSRRFPSVAFVLAGTGVDMDNPEIASLVTELGLGSHVRLLGERSDIARLNAAFDIATSSSSTESFPNAIGEAMACGAPCVVTDVGDSPLLVGECGRVVPPKDPEALAAAWEEILRLPEPARRDLGRCARERILREYALDAIAAAYDELYRSARRTAGEEP